MISLCCDPGIRTLSLCIMNDNYEILYWDTINILEADEHKCKGIQKNGKICNKKCTVKYDKTNYSCKTHCPKNVIKKEHKKKNIDNYLLQDIATLFLDKIEEIYNTNEVFKQINSIHIELQPKCNPKLLFISHLLYAKFITFYKNTIPIKFVRASQKLKAYTGPYIDCKLKGAYAKRKFLSVQYGQWFLENKFSKEQRDKWVPTLIGKCDDRFDTMLMAINSITGIPKKQLKSKKGKCIK